MSLFDDLGEFPIHRDPHSTELDLYYTITCLIALFNKFSCFSINFTALPYTIRTFYRSFLDSIALELDLLLVSTPNPTGIFIKVDTLYLQCFVHNMALC